MMVEPRNALARRNNIHLKTTRKARAAATISMRKTTTATTTEMVTVRPTIKDTSNLRLAEAEEDKDRREDTHRRTRIRITRPEDNDPENMATVEQEAVRILDFKGAEEVEEA
jgi:hypothetical protein